MSDVVVERPEPGVALVLDEPVSGREFALRGWASESLPSAAVEARAIELGLRAGRSPRLVRLITEGAVLTPRMPASQAAAHTARHQRATLGNVMK